MKKYKETTVIHTDADGVVTSEKHAQEMYVSSEPRYVKLYLEDILNLVGMSGGQADTLHCIIKEIQWDNRVYIQGTVRTRILKNANIKPITLSKALERFVAQGILFRENRGVYIVNPKFFGQGKWKDVQALRMTIEYSAAGRKITTDVEKGIDEEGMDMMAREDRRVYMKLG